MAGCPPAGREGKQGWHVNAAFDDVPASFNSPDGTIVSANNKLEEREYPPSRAGLDAAISRQRCKELLIMPYRFKASPVQFENGG